MFPFSLVHKLLYSVGDQNQQPIHSDHIPRGAHQLPLVHSHNGRPCEVSLRNQQRIKQYQDQIAATQNQVDQSENAYRLKITELETQIQRLNQQSAPQFDGVTPVQNEIHQIEDTYKSKIHPWRQQLHDLQARLQKLTHTPSASQLESEIRGITLDLQRLPKNVTSDHWDQRLRDCKAGFSSTSRLLDQEAAQLHEPSMPSFSEAQIQQKLKDIELQKNNLQKDYQNAKKTTTERYAAKKRALLENVRVMQTRYDGLYNKYLHLQKGVNTWTDNVRNLEQNLERFPAKPPEVNTSQWDSAMKAAQVERENAKKRADALRKSTQQELSLLSKANNDHLSNFKRQIDTDISNIHTLTDARIKELKYNRDNTMYQLSYGSETTLPILQKSVVEVPVLKPVLVESTEPVVIETLRATPQYHDVYLQSGKLAKPYSAQIKLKERPAGDTTIIHSRSVPRLVAEEHERVIEKQEERIIPHEKTIMRKREHTETVPGSIYTTSVPLETVVGTEEIVRQFEHVVPKEVRTEIQVPGKVFTRKVTLADFNQDINDGRNSSTKRSSTEKIVN